MAMPAAPPLDGSISEFSGFVDFHAQYNSGDPCYVFASSDPSSSDLHSVSFLEFAQATHRVANLLRPKRTGTNGAVVAIVINSDTLLYDALLIGLVRADLVPFPMSPRNSAGAIASMCQRTDCHRIIAQPSLASLIDETRATLPSGYSLQVDMLPEIQHVFPTLGSACGPDEFAAIRYPAPEPPSPSSEVTMYIHSSGSTGFPKPIPQTRSSWFTFFLSSLISDTRDRGLKWGAMSLPPFHAMGIYTQLYIPFVTGLPIIIYPPQAPAPPVVPTPENTLEALLRTHSTAAFCAPTFLEVWAQDADAIAGLTSLEILVFAGGPLSGVNGNKLAAAGVHLQVMYGTTEVGPVTRLPDVVPDADAFSNSTKTTREDWEWIRICPKCTPRWVPQGDGTYELVFLSNPRHLPCVENLPNGERGYATSDLCEPHPTKPGLWRLVGRTDDVIVLGSGEKTVPIPQESHINAHPFVTGAVMFGRGRLQVGILVEPHPMYAIAPGDTDALVAFRNAIWSQVEEANHTAPAFSRIFKEMILVTDPARPIPRAGKGTFIRKATLSLYDADINALYELVDNSKDANGVLPPHSWTHSDVKAWLDVHAAMLNGGNIPVPDIDLFEQGFDSLSATFLRNRIIGALRDSTDLAANAVAQHVQPNFVYAYSTMQALTAAIVRLVHPEDAFTSQSSVDRIKEMITKYTARLPPIPATIAEKRDLRSVVLLTGTTGGLGSYILADLLVDTRIARVYALNRGNALATRQHAVFREAHLPTALLEDDKLVLLAGDLSREDFGLETTVLDDIRHSVTHIVHNAWRVDFNLSLSSFETQVDGAVRLASFVPGARFLFTSSVSVAGRWDISRGPVPEAPLGDPTIAMGFGYAESKFVVEEVLAAAREAGIEATTLRIGQICGTVASGAWNSTDWVPSLVKSSISLQCLPELEGVVSWLPSDAVARAVVDVMLGENAPATVNIVHPYPVQWHKISGAINKALGLTLPSVPLDVWVQKLEHAADSATAGTLEATPAVKLLEFFRGIAAIQKEHRKGEIEAGGMPIFGTTQLQKLSPTLAKLPLLDDEHAKAWIKYWKEQEFIY